MRSISRIASLIGSVTAYRKIKVSAYFFDQAGREIFQNHAAIPQFDG